jgi:hypothetical protein
MFREGSFYGGDAVRMWKGSNWPGFLPKVSFDISDIMS